VLHQEVVEATRINEDGTVLGMVQNVRIEKGSWVEFAKKNLALIRRSGSVEVLNPDVSEIVELSPRALNNANTVVFSYVTSRTDWGSEAGQIVLGKTKWLGNVIHQSKSFTVPSAINEKGVIAGYTSSSRGKSISEWGQILGGFIYRPGSGMKEIPSLGGQRSTASDINEAGVVVGASTIKGGDIDPADPKKKAVYHGFIYKDGVVRDLNDLVKVPSYVIANASKINDRGDILVRAEKNGTRVDMVLRPKPGS
jgi:probable HAF family extracellular repeat protein